MITRIEAAIEWVRRNAMFILGGTIAILAALLERQSRKTDKAESELASAESKHVIKENDNDRQIAKEHADNLVKSYTELKSEYDENRTGGGS